MTISNPSSGPTFLANLVALEHARLLALAEDASIRTPTPGVRERLARTLAEHVVAHREAEVQVIEPVMREMLGDDAADRVRSLSERIHACAEARPRDTDGLDDWVHEMRRLLDEHCQLLDDQLMPELAERDPDRMGRLGHEFGQALGATVQR